MQVPLVHLNGTSKDALVRQNVEARTAVRKAMEALIRAAPHGRDFYPLGNEAWCVAQDEFNSRLARLREVFSELEELVEHIEVQGC